MNRYCLCFLVFFILGYNIYAQNEAVPYRLFVELKAGLHRERNLLTDPGGQLRPSSQTEPTTGINVGVLLNNGKSVIGLDYDVVTIGNSFIFRSSTSNYISGRSFHRLTPNFHYQFPISEKNNLPKLSFVGKIGPTITFTNSPLGSTGTISNVWFDSNNDTTAFILTQRKLNRTFFAGLTVGAGILFTPNPRLRFSYSIYPSWNLSSNDVIIQDIEYRYFNTPFTRYARALSTGTTLTHSLAMGYAFGKTQLRKEQIEKKERLYTAEEWDKRKRWSLLLHTSNTYPVIKLNDPAGHLTRKPVERFTYGVQVFYRIKQKWQVGTGFESVPFQLDARIPSLRGGDGSVIRNSLQIPLFAEYQLLHTTGKIKFEMLARGGFAFGLQRKEILNHEFDFGTFITGQPTFYFDEETRDRPSKNFMAVLTGLRMNVNLSKTIFLSGYANYQQAITKNAFHRSRARYQVNNPQAPINHAELTTRGCNFLPGFGIGFRL